MAIDSDGDHVPGNWSVYSIRPVTLARVAWLERECPGWERHDFEIKNHSNHPVPKAYNPYAKYAYKLCAYGKAISRMHSKLAKLREETSAQLTKETQIIHRLTGRSFAIQIPITNT